jgi:YidC/Oxa1 family membrane protein insertase
LPKRPASRSIRRPAGSINLRGARIDDLLLKRHTQGIARNSPAIRLFSPAGAPEAYFANFGWTGEGVALPGPGTVWTASGKRLTPSSPITLSWNNGQGQNFEIRLGVDDGYMFTAEQIVTNTGTGAVAVRPFTLISRATASKDPDPWTAHVGAVGVFNGAANYDWGYAELAEQGDQRFNSRGGWLGFSDTYWLTAVIPDQRSSVEAGFLRSPTGGFQAVATPAPSIVQPGSRPPISRGCSRAPRKSRCSTAIRSSSGPSSSARSTGAGSAGS